MISERCFPQFDTWCSVHRPLSFKMLYHRLILGSQQGCPSHQVHFSGRVAIEEFKVGFVAYLGYKIFSEIVNFIE